MKTTVQTSRGPVRFHSVGEPIIGIPATQPLHTPEPCHSPVQPAAYSYIGELAANRLVEINRLSEQKSEMLAALELYEEAARLAMCDHTHEGIELNRDTITAIKKGIESPRRHREGQGGAIVKTRFPKNNDLHALNSELRQIERSQLFAAGHALRSAALSVGAGMVHVLFALEPNQRVCIGRYMHADTYPLFPYPR